MAIEQTKEFTGGFPSKPFFDFKDVIAGTNALGAPIRSTFSQFMARMTQIIDGYFFKGVATPTTNPHAVNNEDVQICYIAAQNGTYLHFDNITIEDEIAILKYSYSGDWTKQTVYSFPQEQTSGEVTFTDLQALLQNIAETKIGVIKGYLGQPAPSLAGIKYINDEWTWLIQNPYGGLGSLISVSIPAGIKVFNTGGFGDSTFENVEPNKYYILNDDGTVTEDAPFDKVNFLKTFIGVKRVVNINPPSLSLFPYAKWAIADLKSHWNYHVDANNVFPLANDTVVQHETSAGVVTYQRLKDDGTQTPVIF